MGLLLATAACGQSRDDSATSGGGGGDSNMATFDVQEDAAAPAATDSGDRASPRPPGVTPTAAPGVAFNYRYAFRLRGERISAIQEQHAAACEKLGLDRCRITGMRYRVVGEDDVEAMLAFKLDPAIARQFGKNGIEAVTAAEGMLVDSEISGEDAGSDIERATRNVAQLEEDLNRVEAQLARAGLRSAERTELQMQAERIRESIRATRANREERRESLAKTPMVFQYGSGDVAPGFDNRSPIGSALQQAWDNVLSGIATLLLVLITLLPWAVALLILYALIRRFGRPVRRFLNPTPEDYAPAPAE